jgi:hypothetical protein
MEVESVESTKFIGVLLDSKLSWAQHIQMVKGKIARGIGIINKARKSLSMPTLVTLYNSIVYPHLIYIVSKHGVQPPRSILILYSKSRRNFFI